MAKCSGALDECAACMPCEIGNTLSVRTLSVSDWSVNVGVSYIGDITVPAGPGVGSDTGGHSSCRKQLYTGNKNVSGYN